ncbi:hypothetical protein P154DRAFT_596788 [Amniculicola lignicola CBS 123094]|uniref:Uncharacterized protein n=1 Tax=Amniculicola lignicola CBS 123094 TaxID=1392246 RepID=A0A6A5WIA5_9PLEO|nr:hypothetical protein P154DRAFT_596788 [Amniculicola lignicola CBS 123094]
MGPAQRNPALAEKLSHMRLTIAPIVHVQTGIAPPEFPPNMLSLFLLTEPDLDSMAQYYSQSTLDEFTHMYPQTMDWNRPFLNKNDNSLFSIYHLDQNGNSTEGRLTDHERLKIKMRMFARFIGLRGTETPRWEYERQMEVLQERIKWSLEEEERRNVERKCYRGPPRMP